MVRNERFRVALDYLYKNGLVADQRELSEKIGVSETSISQILNNRVKKPSESTIRKLNEAFGNIFGSAGGMTIGVNDTWDTSYTDTW